MNWMLDFNDPTPADYTGQQRVKGLQANCSEMDSFTAIFNEDFFWLLRSESNKYAKVCRNPT
jgi:hypothetical protein